MEIIEINSAKTKRAFFDVARQIYINDKNWTCPLDMEIESVFNPDENTCFRNGEAIRWVLNDETGKTAGRIAAFVDYSKAKANEQATGGIGFFECADNQQAADMLFDTAKNWLQQRGMEAMDGPINFGENYMNWGLLVDGFIHQAYGIQYHLPYYKSLFENYGFKVFYNQFGYHLNPMEFPIERFKRITKWSEQRGGFSYKQLQFSKIEEFVDDFVVIFNRVWQSFKEDYSPLDRTDILKMFNNAKPIADVRLVWFAYHHGKPIGAAMMLPDVNQVFKRLNGKLHFINMFKFAWLKWRKTINRTRVILLGVVPEFQKSGIEAGLIAKMYPPFESGDYKQIEISWVGDFNTKMRKMAESINAKHVVTHSTYRYLFDRKKEFKRYPVDV